MSDETHDIAQALLAAGTATVTWQLNRRGLWRCWLQGVAPLFPGWRCAGPAATLRFSPAREDLATAESYQAPGSLREALEATPAGAVVVADGRGCRSMGLIGDMYATRLKVLGAAGFVTDTPVRDGEGLRAVGLPVFSAGLAAPASIHGLHYLDHGLPIGCGEVTVVPGDLMVCDGDGAIVVPRAIAGEVAEAALEQAAKEPFILELLQSGRGLVGTYPPDDSTTAEYAAWKARKRT